MPESTELTVGAPYEVVIEQGKIREFADAMDCSVPEYRGPNAIIPPTFLMSGVQWATEGSRVSHGFDRKRLLHGEQEFRFFSAPPKVGDTLVAQERLVDRFEKPGKRGGTMRFAIVATEYRSSAGDLVAEARATYIETAKPSKETS